MKRVSLIGKVATSLPNLATGNYFFTSSPTIAVGGVPAANSVAIGYSQTSVTAGLPSNFTATVATVAGCVRVFARVA